MSLDCHEQQLTTAQLVAEVQRLRASLSAAEQRHNNGRAMAWTPAVNSSVSSDAALQMILEQVPVVLWAVDTDLRITLSEGGGLAAMNLRSGETVGTTLYEFLQKSDNRQATIDAHLRALAGATISWQNQVRNRVFESHIEPIRNAAGSVVGVMGVASDITGNQAAIDALRESEIRYRTLAEATTDGIWHIDRAGYTIYANPGLCAILELDGPDDLNGKTYHQFFTPDSLEKVAQEHASRALGNPPKHYEAELIGHRGGRPQVLIAGAPLLDQDGKIKSMIGTFTDITAQKQAERELRQNAETLRHTEKLAATGRMAARIAHEINNPLAGIKNSFLLIKDAVRPQHPYFSYVGRIEKEIDRIAGIVGQMLDMYRPDQESPREFKIAEAVQDVVAFLVQGAEDRGVRIAVQLPEAHKTVVMPESWVRQILYNVLQNAIEASPNDSVVGVVVCAEELARGILDIRVSDQGPGISPRTAPHIFEPFFTTKRGGLNRGGLGLGLSTSRSLVQSMGGTITFDRDLGGGTTFQIRIPQHRSVQEYPCRPAF